MGVVAQLRHVNLAGFLGVDDGRAPEAVGAEARLQVQLSLVAAPGAVGQSHDCLPAVLQATAQRLQIHILDEVTVGVIEHERRVSVGVEHWWLAATLYPNLILYFVIISNSPKFFRWEWIESNAFSKGQQLQLW